MASILEVENLSKSYKGSSFALNDVSFSIPYGSIVGFIGENGAGKSTTMGAILGTLRKSSGSIQAFGNKLDVNDRDVKEDIGVVFDDMKLPGNLNVKKLGNVFRNVYKQWNQDTFDHYTTFFSLPESQKISGFSRGMSMKLSIAVALSHDAKLLILDEATGGLDPSGRDDLLNVLKEFVNDEQRGILLSSHITSDIEKVADELVFIKNGSIILKATKEDLMNQYGILECSDTERKELSHDIVVAHKKNENSFDVLVSDLEAVPTSMKKQDFSIDDITLLLMRGEKA